MATYYVNNVTGNVANNGLSTGAAKSHPADLMGLLVAGDIIRQAATGVDYIWTNLVASSMVFSTTSLMWTNWVADGLSRPLNIFNKPVGGAVNTWTLVNAANFGATNINFRSAWNSETNTVAPMYFMGATSPSRTIFIRCGLDYTRIGNAGSAFFCALGSTSGYKSIMTDCDITFDGLYAFRMANNATAQGQLIKSRVSGMIFNAASPNFLSGDLFQCYKNTIEGKFSSNNNLIFRTNATTTTQNFTKNTIIIRDDAGSYTGCRVFEITNSIATSTILDNIVISFKTTTHYLYGITTAYTQSDDTLLPMGNNAYYGANLSYQTNITNFIEGYVTSPAMSGSPFLSTTFGNANYCKLDSANANATTYCINKSYLDATEDLGAYGIELPSSGGDTFSRRMVNQVLGFR